MKVSLRKANAIQSSIVEAIASLEFVTDVQINEFEQPSTKLDEANKKFAANLVTRAKLQTAQYEIRRAVARANAESGINDLLSEVAQIEKDISFYNRFTKARPALSINVIEGKIAKIKNRTEDQIYGIEDSVTTSIFSEAVIKDHKDTISKLKKAKVKLQDSLLEKNVSTTIEISDESQSVLSEAGII